MDLPQSDPDHGHEHVRRRRWRVPRWRAAAVGAFCFAGALFVTTSLNAGGLDLRESSVTDLGHVVGDERDRVEALQDRLAELNAEVKDLSSAVDDREVRRLQREARALHEPAGFTALEGPGLTVTLDDVPVEERAGILAENPKIPSDALVIHQQDIQAVVNALWAGGAEAMSLMGVRIISTTGIKCVGNTVILQGLLYSPPYVIRAIGDPTALRASLAANDNVGVIERAASSLGLGYDVSDATDQHVPAYSGGAGLKYAEAAPAPVQR